MSNDSIESLEATKNEASFMKYTDNLDMLVARHGVQTDFCHDDDIDDHL